MSGEAINVKGSYATCLTAASVSADALSGASDSITTAISGQAAYPLLDFKITNSSGTPVAGKTIDVYRRPSDGTNQSPAPVVADFLSNYVGTVTIDDTAATTYYYLYSVTNPDPADTYYLVNNNTNALTLALAVRGRTYGPAA
jgi:hypothetical protein